MSHIGDYFQNYTSATVGCVGTPSFYESDGKEKLSRVYYKMNVEGEYPFSLLYTNITDSTYSNGSISYRNEIIEDWDILSCRIGVVPSVTMETMVEPKTWLCVSFDGKKDKHVHPGEYFTTDPCILSVKKNEYLCIELLFKGQQFAGHRESSIPSFVHTKAGFTKSMETPLPSMVGCLRHVKSRINFFGDSITQGLGTEYNAYTFYAARVAENLGMDYAYWDLGIGYGRGDDAATGGSWINKAKHGDIVSVCYGVNDILQGYTTDEIKKSLTKIVKTLKNAGCKVVLNTIPPFDYVPEKREMHKELNRFILQELSLLVDGYVDVTTFLAKDEEHYYASKYGPHPNKDGHKIWGEELTKILKLLV